MHEENESNQLNTGHGDDKALPADQPVSQATDDQHVASAVHLQSTDPHVAAEDSLGKQTDPMDMPGEVLKQARERLNYSIESVAQHLKLSLVNIQAIESNQYDAMQMAPVFIKGHLRRYACYVKIDPEYMIRCYAKAGGDVDEHNALQGVTQEDHQRLARKRTINKWLLIDGAAILAVIAVLYLYMHADDRVAGLPVVEPKVSLSMGSETFTAASGQLPSTKLQRVASERKSDSKQVFTLVEEDD